jgi:hypothetical protein
MNTSLKKPDLNWLNLTVPDCSETKIVENTAKHFKTLENHQRQSPGQSLSQLGIAEFQAATGTKTGKWRGDLSCATRAGCQ